MGNGLENFFCNVVNSKLILENIDPFDTGFCFYEEFELEKDYPTKNKLNIVSKGRELEIIYANGVPSNENIIYLKLSSPKIHFTIA